MAIPKSHRSGGPRTAAGRHAVAGNALRTGAYAAQVVLPGENPAHFQDLEQAFLNDFAPADIAEATLVHQLAVITWKKLRLDRIEHSHFLGLIHRPYLQLEIEPVQHLLPPMRQLQWVNETRHHTRAERDGILAALQCATSLCTVPEGGYPANTVARIQAEAPVLYRHLQLEASEYNSPIAESDWLTDEVTDAEENDGIFLALSCASFCRVYADWEWLLHHREAVEQALQQLQERRILISMQQSNVGRIHDDLDRAFQRTLGELRRQQNWRRDRATLTIVPSDRSENPPIHPVVMRAVVGGPWPSAKGLCISPSEAKARTGGRTVQGVPVKATASSRSVQHQSTPLAQWERPRCHRPHGPLPSHK